MIVYSRVSTQPGSEPVTLDEAKLWLKVDGSDEDALITSLIVVARQVCETYAGLSFITQTRQVKLDRFCGDVILPYGPVTSVTQFIYFDPDDAEQEITEDDYTLDIQSGLAKIRIGEEGWPSTNRQLNNVAITYEAGYATAADVPEVAKLAIKKRMALDYEKRGDTDDDSEDWMRLLDTIKVYWNAEV